MGAAAELISGARELVEGLSSLGRLQALRVLGDGAIQAQLEAAQAAVARLEQASLLEEFLSRHYGQRGRPVFWAAKFRPDQTGALSNGEVSLKKLERSIAGLSRALAALIDRLDALAQRSSLSGPFANHLRGLRPLLPAAEGAAAYATERLPVGCLPIPVRGPPQVPIDPIFKPSFNILKTRLPAQPDSARNASPHFWCLSFRETMASELCALCLVETEGMPLAFYRDFAKQTWDEARHARFFLDCALETLPAYLAASDKTDPLLADARAHAASGSGLPVPREGNFYRAIWSANLEDRIVLMHIDSEGPGVAEFKRQRQLPFIRKYPRIADGLELAAFDEATHVKLGRRWLEQLLPDQHQRAEAIKRAMALRGIFILGAIASSRNESLLEMLA